jgi:hypothetical protein
MNRIDLLRDQIRSARRDTERLLAETPESAWFRMPQGGVTHIAWQVGHLAIAEYRLGLERIRGRRDDDETLLPSHFLRLFGRGSVPEPGPSGYPSPRELRAVFDRVHVRTLSEVTALPDATLDEPPSVAHPRCETKGQVLGWCAGHEMFHAGQIALIRRLLGSAPLW